MIRDILDDLRRAGFDIDAVMHTDPAAPEEAQIWFRLFGVLMTEQGVRDMHEAHERGKAKQ